METGIYEKEFLSKRVIYERLREIGSSYGEHMAVDKESAVLRCSDALMMEKAANVAPVIRAKWISFLDGESIMPERYYRCSKCGRVEKRKEPYCHCGAKMDGETK